MTTDTQGGEQEPVKLRSGRLEMDTALKAYPHLYIGLLVIVFGVIVKGVGPRFALSILPGNLVCSSMIRVNLSMRVAMVGPAGPMQ